MKKGIVILFFALVLMVSFVSAMKAPINVYTEPGNRVKVYAWIPKGETQSLYDMKEGIADEFGTFSVNFFSLVDETVKYQVRVLNGLIPSRDNTFENYGTQNALRVDCTFEKCVMSIDDKWVEPVEEVATVAVTEEVSDNQTNVEETNDSNETVETSVETTEDNRAESAGLFAGLAVFTKSDGSTNWFGISLLGVVLILVIGGVFMFLHRGNGGSVQMMSDDERELRNTQRRMEEVESELKNARSKKEIKEKIETAKHKLALEEKELKRLMYGDDATHREIREQKQVVEDARGKLEEHESNP